MAVLTSSTVSWDQDNAIFYCRWHLGCYCMRLSWLTKFGVLEPGRIYLSHVFYLSINTPSTWKYPSIYLEVSTRYWYFIYLQQSLYCIHLSLFYLQYLFIRRRIYNLTMYVCMYLTIYCCIGIYLFILRVHVYLYLYIDMSVWVSVSPSLYCTFFLL